MHSMNIEIGNTKPDNFIDRWPREFNRTRGKGEQYYGRLNFLACQEVTFQFAFQLDAQD